MDSNDITYLLLHQPQFFNKLDTDNLIGLDISWLLRRQPQFFDQLATYKMDKDDISFLLRDQPQFLEQLDPIGFSKAKPKRERTSEDWKRIAGEL